VINEALARIGNPFRFSRHVGHCSPSTNAQLACCGREATALHLMGILSERNQLMRRDAAGK
jgi:hypothetical protein